MESLLIVLLLYYANRLFEQIQLRQNVINRFFFSPSDVENGNSPTRAYHATTPSLSLIRSSFKMMDASFLSG